MGIVGAGFMGAGVGRALLDGGAHVVTGVAGRSERTRRLIADAGLTTVDRLDDVLDAADVILSIVPPAAALAVAGEVAGAVARTGRTPLFADLNAIAPPTVEAVADLLADLDVVDGSISGPPPDRSPGATVYFSGPRAAEIAGLPWNGSIEPVIVSDRIGAASAVKMCTASVYKGLGALMTNALATAHTHGVVDLVVGDLGRMLDPVDKVALSASKADRFVGEMLEIAATQRDAGLSPALFEAVAEVWRAVATTELAHTAPEDVGRNADAQAVVRRLRTGELAS
ncbi:6-phosphogluconate dehydrogenase [Phytomonospora endophytica]|nr:6-phosphogluconate dehydrogenase [Phytomonospora endophytica]